MQHELKFYRAFREDAELAEKLLASHGCSPRHVVLLLHDALEFLFYECLLLRDIDIYESGQSTIGFEKAYGQLIKSGYRLPYVATIREIQKLRGDAKHHAQDLGWEKVSQLVQRWRVVCICVTWELVAPTANRPECEWAGKEYSRAQYLLYQRSRNKDWTMAMQHLIAAVAHKKCDADANSVRPVGSIPNVAGHAFSELSTLMSAGLASTIFQPHQAPIAALIASNELQEACEVLAQVYSALESENPTEFDAKTAVFLTDRLALASARRRGIAGMSWHGSSSSDTSEYRDASDNLARFLRDNPPVVQRLGEPYYDHDDDRYWEWWELVVFDGQEWHSLHLDYRFQIKPESYALFDDAPRRRECAARLVLHEFTKAAQQGHAAGGPHAARG